MNFIHPRTHSNRVPCSTLAVGMFGYKIWAMNAGHRKQCKRYDIEGDAHCLTFSCYRRLPLFQKERSCRWMLDALKLGRDQGKFHLWAYVIMPEHVHIVLLPQPDFKISEILTTLKQSVSKRALIWIQRYSRDFLPQLEDLQPNGKRAHRFWQRGGGYDRNLRTLADIYEKIEYVHNNPVRRGLTKYARDWPWSSCQAWETGVEMPIAINRQSLPPLTQVPET
jgi:putative transposase